MWFQCHRHCQAPGPQLPSTFAKLSLLCFNSVSTEKQRGLLDHPYVMGKVSPAVSPTKAPAKGCQEEGSNSRVTWDEQGCLKLQGTSCT